jgi:hypothetical protein
MIGYHYNEFIYVKLHMTCFNNEKNKQKCLGSILERFFMECANRFKIECKLLFHNIVFV